MCYLSSRNLSPNERPDFQPSAWILLITCLITLRVYVCMSHNVEDYARLTHPHAYDPSVLPVALYHRQDQSQTPLVFGGTLLNSPLLPISLICWVQQSWITAEHAHGAALFLAFTLCLPFTAWNIPHLLMCVWRLQATWPPHNSNNPSSEKEPSTLYHFLLSVPMAPLVSMKTFTPDPKISYGCISLMNLKHLPGPLNPWDLAQVMILHRYFWWVRGSKILQFCMSLCPSAAYQLGLCSGYRQMVSSWGYRRQKTL